MAVDIKHVEHIAQLGRLHLSDAEKESLTRDLNNILTYVDKISELDTSNVQPTSHMLPLKNVVRADEVKPSPGPEVMLANAPERVDSFFKVPAIIE